MENLSRGAVDIITKDDFARRLQEGRVLRVKAGFDPTRPDLHLGHMVLLKKMREFQDLGHVVVLIVGDFTAMIGDPSGKDKARPRLSKEEVLKNAQTYTEQAFLILDKSKTEIRFNSEWFSKIPSQKIFEIVSKVTTEQLLARRDFRTRLDTDKDIYLHEILYPVLQGYDSIAVEADIEIGGTDQLFNLLMGREMMAMWGMPSQVVMTMPLLVGTDARFVEGKIVGPKMSKSLNNYVGLTDSAQDIEKKILALDNEVAKDYFRLLSEDSDFVDRIHQDPQSDVRLDLAKALIAKLHP
jgi:tyrosyl-tRNA synthetase